MEKRFETGHRTGEEYGLEGTLRQLNELYFQESQGGTPEKESSTEADSNLTSSVVERQYESVDALISCVVENNEISEGKPVAAFTIYRCLLQWKSFEAGRTSVFDRLIQMIDSEIEKSLKARKPPPSPYGRMTLVFLSSLPPEHLPETTSPYGRMTLVFLTSLPSANHPEPANEGVRQVEAKDPALLFKQQLATYVERIYGILGVNLKKELSSILSV